MVSFAIFIDLVCLQSSDSPIRTHYSCASAGKQRQHPFRTPLGNRQVLHWSEAGSKWLLQGTGLCFHEEVTCLHCFVLFPQQVKDGHLNKFVDLRRWTGKIIEGRIV